MVFILMRIFFLAIAVLGAVPIAMLLATPHYDPVYDRPDPEHDAMLAGYGVLFWALSAFLWWFDIVRHRGTRGSNQSFACLLVLGLIWISVIYGVKYYLDVSTIRGGIHDTAHRFLF